MTITKSNIIRVGIIISLMVILIYGFTKEYLSQSFNTEQIIASSEIYEKVQVQNLNFLKELHWDEIFIDWGSDIELFMDKILINDAGSSKIIVTDKDFNFIRNIGRRGEGPGEFNTQNIISASEQFLYVVDNNLRRISIFDNQFEFQNHIHFHNSIVSLTQSESNVIMSQPEISAFLRLKNNPHAHLLKSYSKSDWDKKPLKFGKFLNIVDNITSSGSRHIARAYQDKLYILFRFYPIMHVYNISNGDLLKEIEFPYHLDKVAENYEAELYSDPSYMNAELLHMDFRIVNNQVYIALHDKHLRVNVHDLESMEITKTLVDEDFTEPLIRQYMVIDLEDNLIFFLVKNGSNRVLKYSYN